jgi:hypothetical protein
MTSASAGSVGRHTPRFYTDSHRSNATRGRYRCPRCGRRTNGPRPATTICRRSHIASPKGSDMSGRGWLVAIGSLEVRRGLRLGERTEPPRLHLRRIARRLSSAMRRRVAGPSMHTRPLSTFGPQRDIGADAGRTDNCERSDADRGEC